MTFCRKAMLSSHIVKVAITMILSWDSSTGWWSLLIPKNKIQRRLSMRNSTIPCLHCLTTSITKAGWIAEAKSQWASVSKSKQMKLASYLTLTMRNMLPRSKNTQPMSLVAKYRRISRFIVIRRSMVGIWWSKAQRFWGFWRNGLISFGINSARRTTFWTEKRM